MGRKSNNGKQGTFRDMLEAIKSVESASKQQKLPEYYIITEGQTEKWYLTHLKNAGKIYFTFSDPKSVDGGDYLNKIALEIDKYSAMPRKKIICIFDVDRFYNNPTEFGKYSKFMGKYTNVNIYNNMPSIEYWFLLHYSKKTITKYYSKTELLSELTKYSPFVSKSEQALKSEIFLKPVSWFNELCGKDFKNLNTAIDNAKNNNGITSKRRMDCVKISTDCDVSYSDMYKLFEINKPNQKQKK
ncbi:MAG: RloB family protein [Bacteroidales bacterium]|nr:RloB family protein [Bacteroidales bacterium]